MRLQDLNWMDVEKYLEHDNRIILVTGSTEQHAYLSLLTDVLIPNSIAEAVAKQENVLVAPPLNFGVSYIFGEFPGTITLSQKTFDQVVLEIFESLFHQGFQRFCIINGHGGNSMPQRLADLHTQGDADKIRIRVVWYNWWQSEAARNFAAQHNLTINHANWGENFPFTRVAEVPAGDKPPVDTDQLTARHTARAVLGDGNFGGPYQVEDDLIQGLFDAVVAEASAIVRSLNTNLS